MRGSRTIVASTLALTLALGGGIWAAQDANAATAAAQTNITKERGSFGGGKSFGGERGGVAGLGQLQDKIAEYLNVDTAALRTQLQESTLAEIAEAQGITRDALKAKLVEWIDAAAASAEAESANSNSNTDKALDSSAFADKLLDSQGGFGGGKGGAGGGREGGGFGFIGSNEAVAELLGLTTDELQTALKAEGATIASIAEEQGVDVQAVIDLQVSEAKVKLDEKLASGDLTQDKYDAALTSLTDNVTKMVNGDLARTGEGRGKNGGAPGFFGNDEAVAELLGLTTDELQAALQEDDATLASVAAEQGVDVQKVIDLLVNEATAKLDEKLAAGELTQAEYDTKAASLLEHATKQVNGEFEKPEGGRGEHGGFKGGKDGAAGSNDEAAAE